jgi:carotenoid cleavage dioxygenase
MSRKDHEQLPSADRRTFLSGAALSGAAVLGAASVLGSSAAQAEVKFPKEPGKFGSGGTGSTPANGFSVQVNRSENTLYDCEVEGKLPDDLNGAFYRVGPDAQYPKPESQLRHRL